MRNNTFKKNSKDNRNFQDDYQMGDFKKSKLTTNPHQDYIEKEEEFRIHSTLLNENNYYPQQKRRSYNSVFDL